MGEPVFDSKSVTVASEGTESAVFVIPTGGLRLRGLSVLQASQAEDVEPWSSRVRVYARTTIGPARTIYLGTGVVAAKTAFTLQEERDLLGDSQLVVAVDNESGQTVTYNVEFQGERP